LCASESTSEFERLATEYTTVRVKKGIRGRSPLAPNSYSRFDEFGASVLALRNKIEPPWLEGSIMRQFSPGGICDAAH
jgi:hypothetical protein